MIKTIFFLILSGYFFIFPIYKETSRHNDLINLNQRKERILLINNEAERRVDIIIDGKPFTSYIYPVSLEKPVLYPVRAASGTIITRGFPLEPRPGERVDHPHHTGIWFNYGNVNGLDFWNNSYAIPAGKKNIYGSIRHKKVIGTKNGTSEGTLDVTAEWVNQSGRLLIKENTKFIFCGDDKTRIIDRITELSAEEDILFTDNKEGFLGIRVDRAFEMPSTKAEIYTDAQGKPLKNAVVNNEGVNGNYRSSEGIEGEKAWGTRAKWMMLSAKKGEEPITVSIIDHPGNIGYPAYWHARGYGLFAANSLGQKAMSNGKEELNFKLSKGKSVTFKFRIFIKSGSFASDKEMNSQFEIFSNK